MERQKIGIYVHIPFCEKKCPYCDFYSFRGTARQREQYTKAVIRAISAYRGRGICADTLYFGGGTPILMEAAQLIAIKEACRDAFSLAGEITLEANPSVTTREKLDALYRGGFNRISFGMQSAVSREQDALGRRDSAKKTEDAVRAARQAGFDNLSVDMMLGIPRQTIDSLEETLSFVQRLEAEHVSAYLLKIEAGTRFDCEEVRAAAPDEDLAADMYLRVCEALPQMVYEQYEISNFAAPGRESRHNLKYWRYEPYLGFGPSAHSFFDGTRFYYPRDIGKFIATCGQQKQFEAATDHLFEELMLRLRLTEGADLAEVSGKYDFDAGRFFEKCEPYRRAGLVRVDGSRVSLSVPGFLVSNTILADILF